MPLLRHCPSLPHPPLFPFRQEKFSVSWSRISPGMLDLTRREFGKNAFQLEAWALACCCSADSGVRSFHLFGCLDRRTHRGRFSIVRPSDPAFRRIPAKGVQAFIDRSAESKRRRMKCRRQKIPHRQFFLEKWLPSQRPLLRARWQGWTGGGSRSPWIFRKSPCIGWLGVA